MLDRLTEVLDGNKGLAVQILSETDTNPVKTFADLLLKEEKKQADDKDKVKGDTIVTDTSCKK